MLAVCAVTPAAAQSPSVLPLKLAPRPTTPAISEADLMTRVYIFADNSMMGRQLGREGNMKGTAYIARELARIGVEPAGENGTYFQIRSWQLNMDMIGRGLSRGDALRR